ncbi:MAG TPA: glycosyl hydrolase family 18 protein [Bacteroidia bacterium]|nr:glycosyl hydrolase family 18 protein [Bacteroidia bacterium]
MKKSAFFLLLFISIHGFSRQTNPDLIGYWHNWDDLNAPYIQLNQVDPRYTIIEIAFATPVFGTHASMQFTPTGTQVPDFINDVHLLQSQGRKVLISIGGATDPVTLSDTSDRNTFVTTLLGILDTYDFDGIDIDLEGSSLSTSGGSISNPVDAPVILLIDAVREIMRQYALLNNKRMILTMAPETAFVQGGMSAFGGIWGAYLPVVEALKDSIEILQVQLYNSGSMYGIDGNVYSQGTADFIVAMTEAVIRGFPTPGGVFSGLSAEHVAVALPACPSAAGSGYTNPAVVESAINYLRGTGPQPGTYTLMQTGGYPGLRGMMTWSINWDVVNTCASSNEYADNYENIFSSTTSIQQPEVSGFEMSPNPATSTLYCSGFFPEALTREIQILNILGEKMTEQAVIDNSVSIDVSGFPKGIYFVKTASSSRRIIIH